MAYNGKYFILLVGGTPIAAAKSDDVESGADTIETSSPQSGPWRTHVTKRKEWQCSSSYLVLDDSALGVVGVTGIQDLLRVGKSFTIVFRHGTADPGVSGTATLTQVKITANLSKLVTGSFRFQGNGPLEAVEQSGGDGGGLE